MIVAMVGGSIVNAFTVHIPIVNLVSGFIVGGFTTAYAALLSVRFYMALASGLPATTWQPMPAPGSPPPPSGPPTIIR